MATAVIRLTSRSAVSKAVPRLVNVPDSFRGPRGAGW